MRAAVMRDRRIVTDTLPDPEPGTGEVLVRTLACGICGSDLHMLKHADKMMASAKESGWGARPEGTSREGRVTASSACERPPTNGTGPACEASVDRMRCSCCG